MEIEDIDFGELLPEVAPQAQQAEALPKIERNDGESPWLWNGEPLEEIDTSRFKCFVYLITNRLTGKRYIGFKTTVSRKTKVVKGRKRHVEVESDWRTYWSSSEVLKGDIDLYGKGNFIREVIHLCPLKGVGKYYELYEQIVRHVLTANSDRYYNGIVNVRLGANALRRYPDVVSCDKILGDELNA